MSHSRGVILVLAALALTVAWLFAASGIRSATGPGIEQPARTPPSPLDQAIAELTGQSDRLRRHLDAPPRLAPPRRDPFRFAYGPSHGPAETTPQGHARAAAAEEPAVTPPLKLVGIAEDRIADRTVRTAIVASPDGLFLVEEGVTFGGRYKVERIGVAEVQVRDTATGATFTLTLG